MADSLSTLNVTVQFDGLAALQDVSLTLKRGEILGLLGPNGAGKTTLVNVLSGFTRPTNGTVLLDGENITRARPDQRARRGVARTFQSVRLFSALSVRENVRVPVYAHHAGLAEGEQAAERALEFVGIANMADRTANSLPYTQERLVGIARALALEPDFLMLDEPAAGMNDAEGQQLVDLIARIPPAYGCGVLLIEHNMPVVMGVCENLHVLRGGKTLASGPREQVRMNRDVIDSYLGGH
ncbi:ABC transporter ATP-binding protein [Aureimonas fodinaquatilis]|uniref:ABC transporter ATP-binding protein n=1 Tax=Aureimonas fodinaquatilis TaxID=2565783 RepID=A0A5B0E0F7_9HYPH|nr:ABC transporter ATP-binding protein [Aureimonas fodinaquatilis]KAA0972166.1 ABC transporter ATP-binding protein [Aureimonas fodinaquatilis]